MSGTKRITINTKATYKAQQEERKKNERNKKRAQQLVKELEISIQQSEGRGAKRLAKDKLENAEKLCKSLKSTMNSSKDDRRNFTSIVEQENKIKQVCDDLERTVVEEAEKERKWSSPTKKMYELERKILSNQTNESDTDDLLEKWIGDEFSEYKSKFEMLRATIENKSGNHEEIFYQLRKMATEYDKFVDEANHWEEKSIERDMLIETIESALTSPEMNFEVRISSYEQSKYAPIILEAWRPGDEKIEMHFELDNQSNFLDSFASGFAGPGHEGGCESAYETLAYQLANRGLEIQTYLDGKPIKPFDQAQRPHPKNFQKQTGSGIS